MGILAIGHRVGCNVGFKNESGVGIVSLGAARKITFRRKDDENTRWAKELAPGSLLYMLHDVQEEWVHAIKRQRHAGPRISLTWRAFR